MLDIPLIVIDKKLALHPLAISSSKSQSLK